MFTEEEGLTQSEVKKSRAKFGLNILPERPPPSRVAIVLRQLKSPLVYVLFLAGLVSVVIGHYSDAVIISITVIINTTLGFLQENNASNALRALKKFVTNKAVVIRGKKRIEIDASRIVPGDAVILGQGARVPADGVLSFANRLYVDESMLTGESVPVAKSAGETVFMGTTVVSGQAVLRVGSTGANTKMGNIAGKIQEVEEDTPLQRQMRGFSRQLVVVVGVLTAGVVGIGVLHRLSLGEVFVTAVALAVSSIPEGLLVSLTAVLAIGMQRILKNRGLVRRLSAAETLGGVTVVCVDKTGTLTQGKMKVVDFLGERRELAEQVILANDLDDPIVVAAFEWGRGVVSAGSLKGNKRLDSIPFSPKERFFASLHAWKDKQNMLFVNGAPEMVLGWSKMPEGERREVMHAIERLTKQGKRVVGFARKMMSVKRRRIQTNDAKEDLEWVGMLAFSDPVRSGVREALQEAVKAGIRIVVVTGDYPHTSEYVLNELGMAVGKGEVLTGEKLEELPDEKLERRIRNIRLFARTTPDQKLRIVQTMKRNGEVVAMMGDGVNDAPALHRADIGVVVGEATDVAKESADLILLDSNFSTIVRAIGEGRAMFENLRKIILYLLCDAFSEIVVVVGGMVIGLPLPVTAAQILWINLVSDGFPGLALTVDPRRRDIMRERPRVPYERLVSRWMVSLIAVVSLVAGVVALSAFIYVFRGTGSLAVARSMAFLTLGLNSLVYVFSVRLLMKPFWEGRVFENKWLVSAVLMGLGLQALPFVVPTLRDFFGVVQLEAGYWVAAGVLSTVMFLVVEIFKLIYRSKVVRGWVEYGSAVR